MGKTKYKNKDIPQSMEVKQRTLLDFEKSYKLKNTRKLNLRWQGVLDHVSPNYTPLFTDMSYEAFFSVVEIVEFCIDLCQMLNLDIKINYDNFMDNLMSDLKGISLAKSHKELYAITCVLIRSILILEKIAHKKYSKSYLDYAQDWKSIKEYFSYYTLSEFIRILVYCYAYKPRQTNYDSSFRALYLTSEFFYFSFHEKLKILSVLYNDILNHPVYGSSLLNTLEITKRSGLSSVTSKSIIAINGTKANDCANGIKTSYIETDPPKRHTDLRHLPLIIEDNVLIWKIRSLDKIIIEHIKSHKLSFYDRSRIESLVTFKQLTDDPSIIDSFITFLNEKRDIVNDEDFDDIREFCKKSMCLLIEKTFVRGNNYTKFENRLVVANRVTPYTLEAWVKILVDIMSMFWDEIRTWKISEFMVSPINPKQNLLVYTRKLHSWSGLCLVIQIIMNKLLILPEYTRHMRYFHKKEESEEAESSEEEIAVCEMCKEPVLNVISHETSILCRGCRLDLRNKSKNPGSRRTNSLSKNKLNNKRMRSLQIETSFSSSDYSSIYSKENVRNKRSRPARKVISSDYDSS